MAYGFSLDDVQRVNRPSSRPMPWGSLTVCTDVPHYSLYRFELLPGGAQPLHFHPSGHGHVFVETGDLLLRSLDAYGRPLRSVVRQGRVLPLAAHQVHGFASHAGAIFYLIGPRIDGDLRFALVETLEQAEQASATGDLDELDESGGDTGDRREKYWGRIETIVDGEVAGKRIFVKKGGQSSLEFHVEKRETYWVHSGLLKVGLRVGRAENRSIVLTAGESYDIHPGVMHMRIALEDTVIIEASTRDSDRDSHLVEDGQSYRHVERDGEDTLT